MPLHDYQQYAVEWLLTRIVRNRKLGAALFLDPGLGKTLITLEFVRRVKQFHPKLRTLVVAPLRPVTNVWPREIAKWGYDYNYEIVHGPRKARALATSADLYITNYESIQWLAEQSVSFDLTVFDELTKLKSWSAKRTKAIRKMLPRLGRRIGLTGTPTPNSYADLHSQMFMIDDGEALGKTATYFRTQYCQQDTFLAKKYNQWSVTEGATSKIESAIADSVLRMSCEEYLDMPRLVVNDVWVSMPADAMQVYRQAEKDLFVELASGHQLTASSASALYGLCRQMANGGGYDRTSEERIPVHLHDAKVDAVSDLIDELGGKNVLVAYQFHHDLERLQKRWPKAPAIRGGMNAKDVDALVDKWNAGQLPILLVQPQSLSHGSNMQAGGCDVIWFGLTDQREIYDQFVARLYRQGQTSGQVRVHRILSIDTVDEMMRERNDEKGERQRSLMDSLEAYAKRKRV